MVSIGLYAENKRWIYHKKETGELDNFDRGNVIPRNWLLILFSESLGLFIFLSFYLIYGF
jgi:hypothetical protein